MQSGTVTKAVRRLDQLVRSHPDTFRVNILFGVSCFDQQKKGAREQLQSFKEKLTSPQVPFLE